VRSERTQAEQPPGNAQGVEWGRINNENSSRSILPKQYERAAFISDPADCFIWAFTLLGGLPLRYGAAEPVLEMRRADARISAGGERLIVYYQAVVARINICDHLAWIFCRA
jgi:hypothetical protein